MTRRGLLVVMALSALLFGGLWCALQGTDPTARIQSAVDPGEPTSDSPALVEGPAGSIGEDSKQPETTAEVEVIRPESPTAGPSPGSPGSPGRPGSDPAPSGRQGSPAAPNAGDQARPGASQPGGMTETAPTAPPPPTLPTPARVPTPRERAERARYAGGAKLPSAGSIPKVTTGGEVELLPLDLTLLAEPEVWAEYWAREGYAAPAMIKTPVRGKLMARLAQQGIAGAKVRLFTFFPATSQLGGPVLPVMMEATSDAQGYFACNLPVPAKWPSGYAKLAMGVEAEALRLVDALLVPDLRIGEANEIGVFWAPEEPYEVEVKVTAARTGLSVAATGRIDPRRWEAKRAAKVFAWFNKVPVGGSGAKLQGTWDILAEPPFVTLLENGVPVLTQRAARKPEVPPAPEGGQTSAEPQIGAPFEPIVFANDGYIALSGRVTGLEDQPVAGATVTLSGDGDPRVAFSDAAGYFLFSGLRDLKVNLRAEHGDFIAADSGQVATTALDLVLKFEYHKPRVKLTLTRADNAQPVAAIWFSLNQLGGTPTSFRAAAANGVYAFEWDKPVLALIVHAPGLKPLAVTFGEAEQAIAMEPGLPLSRRPRDYDAASWPEGWHTEGETPCLWSLDDDHWVEYRFNLGETEATFALELGVKNHSYGTLPLDNEYLFEVEVSMDGQKVATLSIPSDAQVSRFVLLALGKLAGEHTLRLKWLNDRYIPGQLDANISYESIELFETAP
ncbi:MAG: carboxypeptidase regulatory-like domain-containing protein [Planctomycetes bacterium]|nr:carboxypeptidase regulatory-like domain-containing protein [Planctomycetota bacterium]